MNYRNGARVCRQGTDDDPFNDWPGATQYDDGPPDLNDRGTVHDATNTTFAVVWDYEGADMYSQANGWCLEYPWRVVALPDVPDVANMPAWLTGSAP